MALKLIRSFIVFLFLSFSCLASAQGISPNDYKAEIGLGGGVGYYIGETNSSILSNVKPMWNGLFRYRFDSRFALKAQLNQYTVSGVGMVPNMLYIGDFVGEFNFFDLEQNPYKRYSKTVSPYIFGGMCLSTDVYNGQKMPQMGIPFGLGLKVKLNQLINLNFEWANRLMMADNYEGYSNPTSTDLYTNPGGLNGTNFLNNDMISGFSLGISINIWKKECDCRSNHSN